MQVKILEEHGYESAAIGFSLSYNTTIERTKELLPKYAWGIPGENKFLRAIQIWIDITAPRFFLTELDTYKISTVRLSESTMHTLSKNSFSDDMFEYPIPVSILTNLEQARIAYLNKETTIAEFKNQLPEGFLQRIIFNCNYANLQNIINQRKNHRLPQWHYFCDEILKQVEHPEFLDKNLIEKENQNIT